MKIINGEYPKKLCCETMQAAYVNNMVYTKKEPKKPGEKMTGLKVRWMMDDMNTEGTKKINFYLKFCPFCGEKIEFKQSRKKQMTEKIENVLESLNDLNTLREEAYSRGKKIMEADLNPHISPSFLKEWDVNQKGFHLIFNKHPHISTSKDSWQSYTIFVTWDIIKKTEQEFKKSLDNLRRDRNEKRKTNKNKPNQKRR